MKKILLVAMAATMFAACTQNEELENAGSNKEIKFNTAVMSTTRATAIANADFKKFTLYAYNGETAIIDGVEFTKPADAWINADAKKFYWPGTDQVDFWGYSVTTTVDIKYTAANKSFDYTVKATADAQEDVLVADNSKIGVGTNNGIASIPFIHALTRMSFKVVGDNAYTYNVSNITVNATSTGTYDLATGKWTAKTADAKVDYTLASPAAVAGTTPSDISSTLMMIPQKDATIKVEYTVTAGDYTTPVITKSFTFDEWTKGRNVAYTITLPSDAVKEMVVEGDPSEWPTATTDGNLTAK